MLFLIRYVEKWDSGQQVNKLTDGSMFDNFSDGALAIWLENEAIKLERQQGYNNTMSSIRQAAKRLKEYDGHR